MKQKLDNLRFRKLLYYYPAKAIDVLYAQYYRYLLHVAIGMTQDEDVAKDIVQETVNLVWENYKVLGQPNTIHIKSYLVAVVRLKSINFYRERLRVTHDEIDPNAWPDSAMLIDEEMIVREAKKAVHDLIATFPRAERECLEMRLNGGLSNEEIAERLKVTVKAVERSVACGYKRFKASWNQRGT